MDTLTCLFIHIYLNVKLACKFNFLALVENRFQGTGPSSTLDQICYMTKGQPAALSLIFLKDSSHHHNLINILRIGNWESI